MIRFRSQSGQPSVENDNLRLEPGDKDPEADTDPRERDSPEAKTGWTNIAATASAEVEMKSFLETLGIVQGWLR